MASNDRMKSPEHNLEIGTDRPNLRLILQELEEVKDSARNYAIRNARAYRWRYSQWPGQTPDGLKHEEDQPDACVTFDGSMDTRIRSIEQHVGDHVTLGRYAFNSARVQAESVDPFAPGKGRQQNKIGKFLKWGTATHMRAQLLLEVPLALDWRFTYGAAIMGVYWWECRRLREHELTIPLLAAITAAQTGQSEPDALADVREQLFNPASFDAFAAYIRSLSPIVSPGMSVRIMEALQTKGVATIPVPYTFKAQPRWRAWRPGVEVFFRDLTGDLQEEPWLDWREWVSETDLLDRVKTEKYDPRFVNEALRKAKGEGSDDYWQEQTIRERGSYDYAPPDVNAYKNMVELHHFIYKAHVCRGVPKLFRTIFNEHIAVNTMRSSEPLVAHHGAFPYEPANYPAVALRYERTGRQILSSQGIPEKCYNWEKEEKTQADALADRAALINAPPLITSFQRQAQVRSEFGPRAVMAVPRGEVSWMPLPQSDGTPWKVIEMVWKRAERFFGIFGENVDPDLKNMRRIVITGDILGEFGLCYELTLERYQQYVKPGEAEAVVGELPVPFPLAPEEILGKHILHVVFDAKLIDVEYLDKQLTLWDRLMRYNQGGTAITNVMFRAGMELVSPDLADQAIEDEPAATEREANDERQALAQILVGMEPPLPEFGNHQLRLDTIQQQLSTPGMAERVQRDPAVTELLKNRIKNLQNQIQQYQMNPEIGRKVASTTFTKRAPETAALTQG